MARVEEVSASSDLKVRTVNDIFELVSHRGQNTALLWQDSSNDWKPITSAQLYARVRALAATFTRWGIRKGDRIAILSENRWEWAVTDFAALALGIVDVAIYATNTADQAGYMLRDSGARVAVVSTREQYEKLLAAGELPALEHVVMLDAGDFANTDSFAAIMQPAPGLETPDADFDAQLASVQPDDLATLIYTSGTTGTPKGVMLTHGNLAANVCVSTTPYAFTSADSCISFLPLSHVTARHVDYALMARGSVVAYLPRFDRLPAAMKAVKPTVFVAVPRVFEKVRQTIEARSAVTPLKRAIFVWALTTGKQHREETLRGVAPHGLLWRLAGRLVFAKIREAFGGSVRVFIAGGAPLGPDTAGWFADAGIRIFEGYGMTETSPVIAANHPAQHRLGSVGPLMHNIQVRLAKDGEIEVKGASVFQGYWNLEEDTRASFSDDGFFRTGDVGALEDGFLFITDRKKELLKTSGGKLVAPAPIENKLKSNALVAHAAVVGDKHKFVSVVIAPNFEALADWAKSHNVPADDRARLVEDPSVKAEFKRLVEAVNKSLAHFEGLKRIHIVPDEWTIESGELTPSMKLKRRVVEQKYKREIADFYRDEAGR